LEGELLAVTRTT